MLYGKVRPVRPCVPSASLAGHARGAGQKPKTGFREFQQKCVPCVPTLPAMLVCAAWRAGLGVP